jgi:hypothetical protein
MCMLEAGVRPPEEFWWWDVTKNFSFFTDTWQAMLFGVWHRMGSRGPGAMVL